MPTDPESQRLAEADAGRAPWRLWGPYLSERQWGTVREDYSANGDAWNYFSHEHATCRAYRWGEDGIAGVSDDEQRLCLALAFWNGRDPLLKERLFGLTNGEGNHGEDVKELYYYLDATPTHSWLKMLYKYPQRAFPYAQLREENRGRDRDAPEFELLDTGIFDDDRYFDIFCEYAKASPDDVLLKITIHNRGPDAATLHVLPQLWFRNTWSWTDDAPRPSLHAEGDRAILARHHQLGIYRLDCEGAPELLFCENETNVRRLYGQEHVAGFFKDAFHQYVVHGNRDTVNPARTGTKAAAHHVCEIAGGDATTLRLRLRKVGDSARERSAEAQPPRPLDGAPDEAGRQQETETQTRARLRPDERARVRPTETHDGAANAGRDPFADFEEIFSERVRDADAFYARMQRGMGDADARMVQRQAFAGLIWSKQAYHYDVRKWLAGDEAQPPPPDERASGRNHDWTHLNNGDIISMPDKWEYPWYAAWDLAFHAVVFALIDPEFAKSQLVLLTREWYMHPNGQLPAYEWAFGDVNPPVHAWAAWRVFQIDRKRRGGAGDLAFLERVFHKLLLNFTWWVNRKDPEGRNIFQGGFLGLDNIGVFDRSSPLPFGGFINQADATSWMAMYSLNLMRIALELARHNHVYEDVATKFFEHFLQIAEAMNNIGDQGIGLWDERDGFYYDVLNLPDGTKDPLKVRSMVGLIPLFAVEVLEPAALDELPDFKQRLEWYLGHRPDLAKLVSRWQEPGLGQRRLLSLLRGHRMKCLLRRMLDETEFLSDHGVRALSRHHLERPYLFDGHGVRLTVAYEPGESHSGLFGGNSNWRGPVWMPVNFLIIESLQKFHHYYGDDFKVECPTGSGNFITIEAVTEELSRRVSRLFLKGADGERPVLKYHAKLSRDPHFRDYVLFHEYFHGDTGRGLGAAHQTGWSAIVAKLLQPRRRDDTGPGRGARESKHATQAQNDNGAKPKPSAPTTTKPGKKRTPAPK